MSVLLPICTSGTQLGRVSGRAQNDTVNSSSIPAWMLSGSRTWLPVPDGAARQRQRGAELAGRGPAVAAQERRRPDRLVQPVLAAVVPVPSSKVYRIGTPDPAAGAGRCG